MNINDIIPDKKKALFLAKKQLPELVCDVVNLEGINYTVPEIQTLLDGITVGGHKIEDESIAINQINAFRFLFDSISQNTFDLSMDFVLKLHNISAKNEALTWGEFRYGTVSIAGTDYEPPESKELDELWKSVIPDIKSFEKMKNDEIYSKSISIFLNMSRNQFFFDVNKRTGRLMMNGVLLTNGLPVINLTAKEQLNFNNLMIDFYNTNNEEKMQEFLKSFIDKGVIKIMSEKPVKVKKLGPKM